MMAKQEAGPRERHQSCSRESWKTTLESQVTYLEIWYSDSLKKGQVTLSQSNMKKGDDDVADDAVRTSLSQDLLHLFRTEILDVARIQEFQEPV